jgi:hypothetical protein
MKQVVIENPVINSPFEEPKMPPCGFSSEGMNPDEHRSRRQNGH